MLSFRTETMTDSAIKSTVKGLVEEFKVVIQKLTKHVKLREKFWKTSPKVDVKTFNDELRQIRQTVDDLTRQVDRVTRLVQRHKTDVPYRRPHMTPTNMTRRQRQSRPPQPSTGTLPAAAGPPPPDTADSTTRSEN